MSIKPSYSSKLSQTIQPQTIQQQTLANQIGFQQIKNSQIKQSLLALGSNHEANSNLTHAKEELSRLGEVIFSEAYINADYTANIDTVKPMYTNQCAVISLFEMMSLDDFVQLTKQIEQDCGRQDKTSSDKTTIVSLDIDVLAVKTLKSADDWLTIAERHPFKAHEWVGIEALFSCFYTHSLIATIII